VSGDRGIIPFRGVAYRLTRLEIDEDTLPDPYMVTSPAVGVYPRPTHINTLDFPVWETGDVEGTAVPGELVELIYRGKVVDQTFADFDGYFLFEKARFHSYIVRSGGKDRRVILDRNHILAQIEFKEGEIVAIAGDKLAKK
jgi:hypothetical protein